MSGKTEKKLRRIVKENFTINAEELQKAAALKASKEALEKWLIKTMAGNFITRIKIAFIIIKGVKKECLTEKQKKLLMMQ